MRSRSWEKDPINAFVEQRLAEMAESFSKHRGADLL